MSSDQSSSFAQVGTLRSRLTERELAEHWRLTPRTLQWWRAEGFGPAWIKIGGRILYLRDSVLDCEAQSRPEPKN